MSVVDLEDLRNEFDSERQTKLHQKYIKDSKDLIEEAVETIRQYQTGEKKPIRFTKPWMNKNLLGGLFPGNIIGIAGSSGHGKSTLLQELENDIFDDDLNPDNKNFILLRNNYEMAVFKLYLRDLKRGLDMKIADILGGEFSEEQERLAKGIQEKGSNPRVKYFENPQTPTDWFSIMCSFCEEHKEASHIIISIDHIALVKQTAGGKKDGIDNLVEYMNLLRHIYKNVSFIILSQLNRNIEERDNPRHSAPRKGDLYQSDFLFQISDVIIVVHNPYKLGLQEHMVMGQDQYQHLNSFKKDPGKKTTVFNTKGYIFYHFIKMREDEDGSLSDLYIERLQKSELRFKTAEPELPKMEPNADLFDIEPSPYD